MTRSTAPRPLWSMGEVAEACGVGISTVRRWRAAGRLPRGYESAAGGWALDERELALAVRFAGEHRRGPGRPRIAGR